MPSRMTPQEDGRNRTFAALREEVVLRDDGRYVIYYSLTDLAPAAGTGGGREAHEPVAHEPVAHEPVMEPWSPDRQPDV